MDEIDFSIFFKTKSQAGDFSTRLSLISQKIYVTDFNIEKELIEQLGMQKKDKFITLLRDHQIMPDKPSALKEFIDQMKEKVSGLPVLSLTLAFEPKEKTLQTLSEWFSLNTKQQVIFDVIVDPELIAGARITFNGKFFDYTAKPKTEQLIAQMMASREAQVRVPQQISNPIAVLPVPTPSPSPATAPTPPDLLMHKPVEQVAAGG